MRSPGQQAPRSLRRSGFWGASHQAGPSHFTLRTVPLPASLQLPKPTADRGTINNFWWRSDCAEINNGIIREATRYALGAAHCFRYNERNRLAYAFPYLAPDYLMPRSALAFIRSETLPTESSALCRFFTLMYTASLPCNFQVEQLDLEGHYQSDSGDGKAANVFQLPPLAY